MVSIGCYDIYMYIIYHFVKAEWCSSQFTNSSLFFIIDYASMFSFQVEPLISLEK